MAKEVYVIPGQMDIFDFISDPEDNRIKIEDAKVLSLFDGMACAMISLLGCEIKVSRYVAYEVDKYAVKTSSHNFPMIEHRGDVFDADFTEFEGFDLLMGGSPCTYWSIAQTKNRETVASGMGWELFSQYVRALKEAKPKAFIYENNKSMSKQIRQSICETFGFEPICINSALVSAQNRNRLYWVGVRQDNGTYKRVNVQQPEDRGILLKHILESGTSWLEKSQTIDAHHYAGGNLSNLKKQSGKRLMAAEPVNVTADGKSQMIKAQYAKSSIANFFNGDKGNLFGASGVAERVEFKSLTEKEMDYMLRGHQDRRWNFANKPGEEDKAKCVVANISKGVPYNVVCQPIQVGAMPIPVCVAQRGRYPENPKSRIPGLPTEQMYEARIDEKSNTLTTVQKDNMVAVPVAHCLRYERTEEAKQCRKAYESGDLHHGYHELHELHPRPDGKTNTLSTVQKDNLIIEQLKYLTEDNVKNLMRPFGSKGKIVGADDKTHTLTTQSGGGNGVYYAENVPECFKVKEATKKGYAEVKAGDCVDLAQPNSKTRRGRLMPQGGKSNCLTTGCAFFVYCGTIEHPIYLVKDGMITVKGKTYPIKLVDGYYIIRKLTVLECMRLQTVPEWYVFPVSNSQAYKMLGNGWTIEVIKHLVNSIIGE